MRARWSALGGAGTLACLCLSLLSLIGGCAAPSTGVALEPDLVGNEAQIDFWHALPTRRVASNDEAFHALLLFVDGSDPAADYAGRVQILKDRQMLPAGFDEPAEAGVRRGTVAVALVRTLDIRGGLTMRLFGAQHPRYAVRELEYANVFPPSSPHQTFSGPELVGIIGRAEDYQRATAGVDPELVTEPE